MAAKPAPTLKAFQPLLLRRWLGALGLRSDASFDEAGGATGCTSEVRSVMSRPEGTRGATGCTSEVSSALGSDGGCDGRFGLRRGVMRRARIGCSRVCEPRMRSTSWLSDGGRTDCVGRRTEGGGGSLLCRGTGSVRW